MPENQTQAAAAPQATPDPLFAAIEDHINKFIEARMPALTEGIVEKVLAAVQAGAPAGQVGQVNVAAEAPNAEAIAAMIGPHLAEALAPIGLRGNELADRLSAIEQHLVTAAEGVPAVHVGGDPNAPAALAPGHMLDLAAEVARLTKELGALKIKVHSWAG